MRSVLLGLACCGCGTLLGIETPDRAADAAVADAAVDLAVDAPRSCLDDWYTHTVGFAAPQAMTTLNTSSGEGNPFVTDDELEIYFFSDRASSQGVDIWGSRRGSTTVAWSAPELQPAFNSAMNDHEVNLTADRLQAAIMTDRTGGAGSADIWLVTRPTTAQPFGAPTQLALTNVNDAGDQNGAFLSADGLSLYLPGIRVASRASTTTVFGAATSLTELGAAANERDPAVTPDERIIVFVANRNDGMGGADLFYSVRASRGVPWTAPVRVPDVNGAANEVDPHLSADGCTLYYSSTQLGTFDLYTASVIGG